MLWVSVSPTQFTRLVVKVPWVVYYGASGLDQKLIWHPCDPKPHGKFVGPQASIYKFFHYVFTFVYALTIGILIMMVT